MKGDRSRPASLYLVTNTVNGKMYVGVTTRANVNRRMSEHVCHAVRKDGNGAFYRAIRKYGRMVFKIEVIARYASAHDALAAEVKYISAHKPEYNSTRGGDAGNGGKFTTDGLRRISESKKGNIYRRGSTHTPEAIERLRQHGYEGIEKFRQYSALGPAAMARSVRCLDDGCAWPSASAAARHYSVAKSALIELCLKDPRRKTVGGRRFEYVVEA